jgi:anti-sigma B factor antagonist
MLTHSQGAPQLKLAPRKVLVHGLRRDLLIHTQEEVMRMLKQQEDRADGLLTVRSNRYGDEVVVVSLAGELDRSNVATAKLALGVVGADTALLVVDLYELEFLDSSGISMLVELSKDRDGETLRIVPSPNPEVTRILDLTGIGSLIQIATDSKAAAA